MPRGAPPPRRRRRRRLAALASALRPTPPLPGSPAAAAGQFVGNDEQGFGIRAIEQPPVFDPRTQHDEAFAFWQDQGFVVVTALDEAEVAEMNAAADDGWLVDYEAHPGELMVFYPLLDYPAVDKFVKHESTMPLISQMLGGWECEIPPPPPS